MWSTVMELGDAPHSDIVRQKLLGAAHEGISIEFDDFGEVTIGFQSKEPTATKATSAALKEYAHLMMRAALSLEPKAIRTYPSAHESVPKLAGTSEIAKILGVTKARASQLVGSEGFPTPVSKLAMGPVYLERVVREYRQRRNSAARRR